jgi:hypothetical protein
MLVFDKLLFTKNTKKIFFQGNGKHLGLKKNKFLALMINYSFVKVKKLCVFMVLINIFLIPFAISAETLLKKHTKFDVTYVVQAYDRVIW